MKRKSLFLVAALVAVSSHASAYCPCGISHEEELFVGIPEKCSMTEAELVELQGIGEVGKDDLSLHVDSIDKSPVSITSPSSTVSGSLSGRIVYLMAGHGWQYNSPGNWSTQRPLTNGMVEDFGNMDQVAIMADMLLNAGATVVPLRPFGFRAEEVVIDNMDPQVTFAGTWSNSTNTPFYGNVGDSVHYRFATAVDGAADRTATYDASSLLPVAGRWPVYTWVRWGSDRINQEYIIGHAEGTTTMRVNHQRVGSGWVYLGTYWFEPGGQAFVQITNSRLSGGAGTNAFADAIRWGNGMGDDRAEGSASGKPRHEENGRYWLVESRGQSSGLTATNSVSSPPRLAAHMNFTTGADSGTDTDRVYLSFHSNAGGGRGADGLFNNNPGDACRDPATANSFNTPNGVSFAQEIGTRLNRDMRTITAASGNPFEHLWGRTGFSDTNLFGSGCSGGGGFSAYGEINNSTIGGQMAATIIETAFHDNAQDAQLMLDQKVREALARFSVHAIINHFASVGAGPSVYPPEQPLNPWITTNSAGTATLNWTAPQLNGQWGAGGGAPTGYIIEASFNGRSYTPVATVNNGSTTSFNVTPYASTSQVRHFRVVATNAGGHSFPSGVVSIRRQAAKSNVLIVNGFERLQRSTNYTQFEPAYLGSSSAGGGTIGRVIPGFNNSFDYSVEVGGALGVHEATFDTAQNAQIISGQVLLSDYDAVFWILGEESTANQTFNATEQTLVENYLASGGNLFLSGSEIAWDLGRTAASAGNKSFLQNTLKTQPFTTGNPEDSSNTHTAQGSVGGIFSGIGPFDFSDGSDIHGKYNVAFPDILNPTGGATTAMEYVGGTGVSAGIVHNGGSGRGKLVYLGFPLEAVLDEEVREDIVGSVLSFFQTPTTVEDWKVLYD